MANSEAPSMESTIFVSKVPRKWSKEQLMEWIDSIGFVDAYDFLYLPQDFHSRENLGYAFINFVGEHHAQYFKRMMMDARIRLPGGLRLCVKQSKLQGRDANLAKWGRSRSRRIHNPESVLYVRRSPSPKREAGSSSAAAAVTSLHGDFEGAPVDWGRGSRTQPSPAATYGELADHQSPQSPPSIFGGLVSARLIGQIPAEGGCGSLQAASAESWPHLLVVHRAADNNVDRSSGVAPLEAAYSPFAPEARVAPICKKQCQWQWTEGADKSLGGRQETNDRQGVARRPRGNWQIIKLDGRQLASGDTKVSQSSSHHLGNGVGGSESFESLGESSADLRRFLPPGFRILDRLSV
jgi:hypothetical protein